MIEYGSDEHFDRAFLDNLYQHRTAIPVKVKRIDHDRNIVDVDVLVTEWLGDKDHKIDTLKELPIVQIGNKEYAMTIPISAGDEGIALFMDRSIDDWENGYKDNRDNRVMDISDGVFIPMQLRHGGDRIKGYDKDALVIRTKDGKTKMKISENEISFVVGGDEVLKLDSRATFSKDVLLEKDLNILGGVKVLKDMLVTGTTKLLETFINGVKQTGN